MNCACCDLVLRVLRAHRGLKGSCKNLMAIDILWLQEPAHIEMKKVEKTSSLEGCRIDENIHPLLLVCAVKKIGELVQFTKRCIAVLA